MRFRNWSIRWKVLAIVFFSSLCVLLVSAGLFAGYTRAVLRRLKVEDLTLLADALARNVRIALSFQDAEKAVLMIEPVIVASDIEAAAVYDEQGGLFAYYVPPGSKPNLPASAEDPVVVFRSGHLVIFREITYDTKRIGTMYVQASLGSFDTWSRRILWGAGLGVLLLSLVALLLAAIVQRFVSDPILELGRAARRISEQKDFSVRVVSKTRDEVGTLTDAFNQMLSVIESQNAALRRAEESIRFSLVASGVGTWEWDIGSRQVRCSENVAALFGVPREQFLPTPRTFFEHVFGPDRRRVRRQVLQAIRSRRLSEFEFRVFWRNGGVHWLSARGQLFLDSEGKPARLLGVVMDVTERRRTEELMREMSAKLEYAVEGICRVDQAGRFLTINRAYAEMIGYDEEEFIGQYWVNLVDPNDLPAVQSAMERLGRETKVSVDFRVRKSSGSEIWQEAVLVPAVNELREPAGFYLFTKDVTARKMAEEKLEQLNLTLEKRIEERTGQLEEANHELESFSYSISHDLRAPLRAIGGFVRILQDDYSKSLDDEGRRLLSVILKNSQHLGALIEDLLSFSRMSRKEVKSEPVRLGSLFEGVFTDLLAQEPQRNVELKLSPLPPVLGDPMMLRQVVVNLMANAFKFTRGRNPAIIEVFYSRSNPENTFIVRDNGVGFDMAYREKLFNVFQRLHAPGDFEGTGVGLAIVKRIILKHGGQVWAASELGQGATFYFHLPVAEV